MAIDGLYAVLRSRAVDSRVWSKVRYWAPHTHPNCCLITISMHVRIKSDGRGAP
ncbi:hypothetical protein ACVIW2_004482 [Bradyrhizobium huanghuaihaiense]|uniref:Transposase n=1 Tax=Bradyrhizobium huanghuaihaiense TaxID=990078 RepID=A0A562QX61_9BRAD|nr:hypothetical protein IQ16_07070 [Bradyrhizobium huanghuaihaiense]